MRPVFLTGSLTAVGWPRRSTDDKSNGGLNMLLKAVGCIGAPFGFAGGVFVLDAEGWDVELPRAGEARLLACALGVPPPPEAAAGVEEGIVRIIDDV